MLQRLFHTLIFAVLCIVNLNSANVNRQIAQPDFAFPKQAAAKARQQLDDAISRNDGNACVRAIIDLQIARTLVDPDSVAEFMPEIGRIASQTAGPATKSLLDILQARIYSEIYSSDRWNYDNRKLPLSPRPADYRLWSGEQFRAVIDSLCDDAVSDASRLRKLPLRDFSDIISCPKASVRVFPSLFDFVAWQSIELLQTGLQFYNILPLQCLDRGYTFPTASSPASEAAKRISKIYSSLIDAAGTNEAPLLYALTRRVVFFSRCVYNSSAEQSSRLTFDTLMKLAESHITSQYSALPLLEAADFATATDNDRYFSALDSYAGHHPSADATKAVRYRMGLMTSPYVNLRITSTVYPGEPFSVAIDSRGLRKATISFYRLPDRISSQNSVKVVNPATYPIAATTAVDLTSTGKFGGDTTITATLDKPGYYFAVVTSDPAIKSDNYHRNVLHCSALSVAALQLKGLEAIAFNPLSGQAVKGAALYSMTDDKKGFTRAGITDADGYLRIVSDNSPLSRQTLSIRKDGDIYAPYLTVYPRYNAPAERGFIQAYTDLAIYHPGDTVRWAAIAYSASGNSHAPMSMVNVKAEMLDANYTEINGAVKDCVTDEFGRISGSFVIPKGLLQGNFTLRFRTDSGKASCNISFMVSDYKLPGFMIECDPVAQDSPSPGCVTLSGVVKTYSGMPLSGTEVTINLSSSSMPWWFRSAAGTMFYTIGATTDAAGRFAVELSSDVLDSAPAPHGLFTATVAATSSAGESREATISFMRGRALRIDSQLGASIDVTDSPTIPVKVVDSGNEVCDTVISYCFEPLWKSSDTKSVAGSFRVSRPEINWSEITSGRYRLTLRISGSEADSLQSDIIVYRSADRHLPAGVTDVVWSPAMQSSVLTTDRHGKASLLVASGEGTTHLLFVLSDSARIIDRRWIDLSEGFHQLPVAVDPEAVAPRLTLYAARDMKSSELSLGIKVPHPESELTLCAESFRDRIIPGTAETWKFTTVDGNGNPRRSALILDMYNSALDELATAPWRFQPANGFTPALSLSAWSPDRSAYISLRSDLRNPGFYNIELPEFATYGYPLYSPIIRNLHTHRMLLARSADGGVMEEAVEAVVAMDEAKMAAPAMMNKMAAGVEVAEDESTSEESAGQSDNNASDTAPFTYRSGTATLAFFRPMLVTEADGSLSFTFTVPDANTTWAFNALGFTDKPMATAEFSHKVLANKPVMVQPNLPRFLRTSDIVSVSSLVMNNSDQEQKITAVTEIFDPVTSEILQRSDTAFALSPSESATADISFRAPSASPFVGFRVKASTDRFADGEQQLIPVLEAAEPLIETKPFYISPDSASFSVRLPQMPSDASVTLQYCENPAWYVVTALPGLSDKELRTSNAAADAYFSAAVADGLLNRFPEIGKAISQWSKTDKSDSTLTSMLQRNADLRTVLLQATPWMLDARSDTERMQRLVLLLDRSNISDVMRRSMEFLQQTQRSSGGWSWTKDYTEPSVWTTRVVLSRFAELRHLGFLPDNKSIGSMVVEGFGYLDKEISKSLRHDRKYTDMAYAMLRTLWPDAPASSSSRKVMANTVQSIVRDWKHFGITAKAEGSIILRNNGYATLASRLVASLEDFAVSTPEKGMWWPSAQSSDDISTLFTTSECLQAMKSSPDSEAKIDAVVQWMILQKEANNWGSSAATSVIASSIISAADHWFVAASQPVFSLGGKPLAVPSSDSRLGYFRMPVDASLASGSTLTISRTGSTPAWGAVYCRFKADMADIRAVEIPDLKITKTLLKQQGTEWVEARDLKVGDRVRVNLTIVSKRQMDYVAVTDNRAACLEPVEQTPVPVYADGLCFYRQNGDNATSLFISSLPAGTYQLGYDMWVNNAGEFASGTASIQSQYAPQLAAHSAGTILTVAPK